MHPPSFWVETTVQISTTCKKEKGTNRTLPLKALRKLEIYGIHYLAYNYHERLCTYFSLIYFTTRRGGGYAWTGHFVQKEEAVWYITWSIFCKGGWGRARWDGMGWVEQNALHDRYSM